MKITRFYEGKNIHVELVNVIDKRMFKFLSRKWNYHPQVSERGWVRDNYITDKTIIRLIGFKTWNALTVDEKVELKANAIVRKHVWMRFHKWNSKHVNRWVVKYADNTDFKISFTDKLKLKENEKPNTGTGANSNRHPNES